MPSGPAFADAKGSEAACFSRNLINQFRVGQWREPTAGTMTMLSEEPTRPFEWRLFSSAGGLPLTSLCPAGRELVPFDNGQTLRWRLDQ